LLSLPFRTCAILGIKGLIMSRLFRRRPRAGRPCRRSPLFLEVLEARTLLSTLTVLNLNDSGAGSLRQAIANAAAGDTINFAVSGQITLTSGPLVIDQNLTIDGPGQNSLTISGNNSSQVLNIYDVNVSLSGLTIANGFTFQSGAGILMYGDPSTNLSVSDCTIEDGIADGNGGAIEITGDGTMNLTGCSFYSNQAAGNGGAIDSPGIFLTVSDSTFSGNSAGNGGAISIGNDGVSIANSTFDSNFASGEAGAIYSDFNANYSLTNCTLARNSAGVGGGLGLIGGSFTLLNTIVAGNSASTAPDVSGPIDSLGHNLIGITDGSSGWIGSDLTGTASSPLNADVGTLGNYGGPTQTDPLLQGSPALGAGTSAGAPTTDQRGDPRSMPDDIGAVQLLDAIVTTTADSGPGSLRQAIIDTNAHPGVDFIDFKIPGSGVHTIKLASALPAITDTVTIDGYSQPGSMPNTLPAADNAVIDVEIDGNGMNVNGLVINDVMNCSISGLSLVDFGSGGSLDVGGIAILGQSADGNAIGGNFLGVLPDGTTADANSDGIILAGDPVGNVIGGTDPADRNLISGNVNWGFILEGSGNTIAGNLIGLDATGVNALANGNGGVIDEGAMDNIIGGTTAAARNYIAGNIDRGLKLTIDHTSDGVTSGPNASGNVIEGNWIGLNIDGVSAGGQSVAGIELRNVTSNSLGVAGAGNVISGNSGAGIEIVGSGAVGNSVQGNLIGTDTTGNNAIPNLNDGILIDSGAIGNTVGGTNSGQGNVISGNFGDGVVIGGGAGPANSVQGNLIGLNAAGTAALGNSLQGVVVFGGIATMIGGVTTGAGNVISGNGANGVQDYESGDSLIIQGNIIGLNAAGTAKVPNAIHGIQLMFAGGPVLIGGDTAADRNVISGNADHGINVSGSNATIIGNYIGTDLTGTIALGNGASGIGLNGGSGNTIGDASSGGGNVISGNGQSGIEFFNGSNDNTVVNNLIGVAADGVSPLGNGIDGVQFTFNPSYANSFDNEIGSLAANAGNVIAFNPNGVVVSSGSTGNTISGNSIFGNTGLGIVLSPGGNDSIAAPALSAVGVSSVSGTLVGAADATYRIEFYVSPAGGPGGQGKTLVGFVTVVTDATGSAAFNTATANIAPGVLVSATATALTDPFAGDTSQFSQYLAAPLPLARFRIVPSTINTTAGQLISFTVSAVDGNGLILTTYQGTVTFASAGTDAGPILPATYTFTTADAGSHTFTAKYFIAGTQTLTVSDVVNGASGSTTVQVVAGAFNHLFISGLSDTTPVGVENSFTVAAVDLYGNVVSGFNDTLHFTSDDALAQLPANSTLVSGIGTFDVTFRGLLPTTVVNGETVRIYSVTVSDKQSVSATATQTVDIPLYLLPSPVQFVEVENVAFTNHLVATFLSDLSTGPSLSAGDFTATIDWGDGSAPDAGTIQLLADGTTFAVYGSHQYPTGQTDYPIDVTITFAGFSSQPVTPSVVAVVTPQQFANLGQNSVVRAIGTQTSLATTTTGANASLSGAGAALNTTLFVADYNDNPQPGVPVAGVSYYDIRATNAANGARLTVTFRFPEGSGVPELEFFDATQGKYVPVIGSTHFPPVIVGPGVEAVTVVFDDTSFPQLSALHGSVFTIVIAPLTIDDTTTISPALALAYPTGSDLTVTRDVSFQGSGVTVGLTPSQDVTRALARAELSGGGDDELEAIDPADLEAIFNVLGFSTPAAEQGPVVAPVAAPPAAPASAPGATGPGAALPPVLPADAIFAAAAEAPFAFQRQPTKLQRVTATSLERAVVPSLLAVPLLGAIAIQPPLRSANRRRRRLGAFLAS
jgi:hypothetical protein